MGILQQRKVVGAAAAMSFTPCWPTYVLTNLHHGKRLLNKSEALQ